MVIILGVPIFRIFTVMLSLNMMKKKELYVL